ncbi:MAG: poly(3-hydroxybutyrate) depolymerase [Rhodospirillales bacterium]|nr:MAG: poly(3-hydroxybutyrate) depolymerase [Rhodospirillales bacterium]
MGSDIHGRRLTAALAAAMLLVLGAGAPLAADQAVERLPRLAVDPAGITVSGISAGGYMALHFHVAHAALVSGAAVIAAGPYHCAGDGYPRNLHRALNVCTNYLEWVPFFGPPDIGRSLAETRKQAEAGAIDDPAHLGDDRVFLFSGTFDRKVPSAVVTAAGEYYRTWLDADRIRLVDSVPVGHAMATDGFGNVCTTSEHPWVNDCGYDTAGELLDHLYPPLADPVVADGTLLAFDQTEFAEDVREASLNRVGFAYVPNACAEGATCRLHIAFHGCQQYHDNIGDAFYRGAGYNGWAEANGIIVLYPQAAPLERSILGISLKWPNPLGCFDWWGFTGPDVHLQSGAQIRAVKAMVDRLAGWD